MQTSAQIIQHPRSAKEPILNPARWGARTKKVVSIRIAKNKRSYARLSEALALAKVVAARWRRIDAYRSAVAEFDAKPGREDVAKSARMQLSEELYEQAAHFSRGGEITNKGKV